jgi:hypothetical protein
MLLNKGCAAPTGGDRAAAVDRGGAGAEPALRERGKTWLQVSAALP